MKIMLLGGYGMLGAWLYDYLKKRNFEVSIWGRFNTFEKVLAFEKELGNKNPIILINLMAMTNVDECEKNPLKAFDSNVTSIENIISKNIDFDNIHLIHISSDQVYDGIGPHKEENISLVNVYSATKYCSEIIAKKVNSTILRINYVGTSKIKKRNSFSDWIVNSLREKSNMVLFKDIFFSPVHALDICEMIVKVIENPKIGVYNLGSRDSISKANFALEIARGLNLDTTKVKISNSDSSKKIARRPLDMSLKVEKFEKAFNVKLPSTSNAIQLTIKDYI